MQWHTLFHFVNGCERLFSVWTEYGMKVCNENWTALPYDLFEDSGHSYEAFTYLIGRNICIHIVSGSKFFFCRSLEISSHRKFLINP